MHTLALACQAALFTGCQTQAPTSPEVVGELRKGKGHLNPKQLPDSLTLLPPPPAAGSAQAAAGMETYKATRALRNTPHGRWPRRTRT